MIQAAISRSLGESAIMGGTMSVPQNDWACRVCTFLNPALLSKCTMCESECSADAVATSDDGIVVEPSCVSEVEVRVNQTESN